MARILIGNIKGPQGAKGDKGDKGDTGPQGPAGPQGATGPMPALVNGFTTTEAGIAALDAAAGKTLKDQLDQQNSDIENGPRGYLDLINRYIGFVVGEYNPSILINPREKFIRTQFIDTDNQSKIFDFQLIAKGGFTIQDGCKAHIYFYSTGEFRFRVVKDDNNEGYISFDPNDNGATVYYKNNGVETTKKLLYQN